MPKTRPFGLFFLILFLAGTLSAQTLVGTISLPTGTQISGMELYQAGSKLFVVDDPNDRILVYHSRTLAPLGEIGFAAYAPYGPGNIAVDEARGLLYVNLRKEDLTGGGTILVMNAETYAVTATVPMAVAGSLILDAAHQRLYLFHDEFVSEFLTSVETVTYGVLGSLELRGLMGDGILSGGAMNPQTGEFLYTNLHYDKFLVVDGPNLTSRLYSVAGSRGWTGEWNYLENKIYITTINWAGYLIYDRDTGQSQITSCVNDATSLYFNPTTNRVYTSSEVNQDTTVIDGATDVCQNIPMPSGALDKIDFVNGPRHAYFGGYNKTVYVLDEKTLEIAKSFPEAGGGTVWDIDVDQVNERVFVFFYNPWSIAVFDDPTPPISVTSPDGGEIWPVGGVHDITWDHVGPIAHVKIEYSTTAGSTWTTIIDSTPNDGSYSWTVPNTKSTTCLVRVSDAGEPLTFDQSDHVFSIPMTLAESLDHPSLTWETGGDAAWKPQSWYVYFGGSAAQSGAIGDGQSTWLQTTVTGPGDLSFTWKVSSDSYFDWVDFLIDGTPLGSRSGEGAWAQGQYPIAAGSHTLRWVYWKNSAFYSGADAAWLDKVEFTPTALPTLAVTSPAGGESWAAGSAHSITWTTTGPVANVRLEYSTNGGAGWTAIAASITNAGTYPWTVPNSVSTACFVRVSEASSGLPTAVSAAPFSIVSPPTIAVTTPNGGEDWPGGTVHNVQWTTTGTVGDVKIEYSSNGGTGWTTIIASTANDGSYSWTVPDIASTVCLIRISPAAGGAPTDTSDAPFTISSGTPVLRLSRTTMNFGAQAGNATPGQAVVITNAGTGTLYWAAARSSSWITVSLDHGIGSGTVNIGVDTTGLGAGAFSGSVSISDLSASNSPQAVTVNLTVYEASGTLPPFGDFATPLDGAIDVTGAIPVTGWALDDIGVIKVEIWRDPVLSVGEDNSLYFIGNGLFVEGARPDVENDYPAYPMSYKAGWGYMLLTNFLPNQGNGTYKLYAIATDKEGNVFTLGTRTITCDNANAAKPFGTIDTPTQGGTASGSGFVNFGWVLTPLIGTVPKDGSTITVYVDGVLLGNLSTPPNLYNAYRPDVSGNFPGLNNTGGPGPGEGGPVGAFFLDTTGYADGVHTIFWIAYDDLGRGEGIGSRFFNILNVGGAPEPAPAAEAQPEPASALSMPPLSFQPVRVKTGLDLDAVFQPRLPDGDGILRIEIPEVSLIRIELGNGAEAAAVAPNRQRFGGFMVAGDEPRPLPVGSTLDRRAGRFSWMPGPGFVGVYELVFIEYAGAVPVRSIKVNIEIKPKR